MKLSKNLFLYLFLMGVLTACGLSISLRQAVSNANSPLWDCGFKDKVMDYPEALACIDNLHLTTKSVEKKDLRFYESLFLTADLQTKNHQTEAAIETTKKMVELTPAYGGNWTDLAELYEDTGQYEKALIAYGKALRNVSQARILSKLGRYDEASGILGNNARFAPYQNEQGGVWIGCFVLSEQGKHQKALECVTARLSNHNYYMSYYTTLNLAGVVLYRLGRYEEALQYFQKSLGVLYEDHFWPDNIRREDILLQLTDQKTVISIAHSSELSDIRKAFAFNNIGHVLSAMNKNAEALVYFQHALEERPANDYAKRMVQVLEVSQAGVIPDQMLVGVLTICQPYDAEEWRDHDTKDYGEPSAFHEANTLFLQGKYEKALNGFNQVIEQNVAINCTNVLSGDAAADLLILLGRPIEALALIEKVISELRYVGGVEELLTSACATRGGLSLKCKKAELSKAASQH